MKSEEERASRNHQKVSKTRTRALNSNLSGQIRDRKKERDRLKPYIIIKVG